MPTKTIADEKSFVFDCPHRTNHSGCALFIDLTVEKLSRTLLHRFDKKNSTNLLCEKTLSDLPLFKLYQCAFSSDMFVYWLSCNLENLASSKKSSLWKKSGSPERNLDRSKVQLFANWMTTCFRKVPLNSFAGICSAFSRNQLKLAILIKEKHESLLNCVFPPLALRKIGGISLTALEERLSFRLISQPYENRLDSW